jgi:hypothetical protein
MHIREYECDDANFIATNSCFICGVAYYILLSFLHWCDLKLCVMGREVFRVPLHNSGDYSANSHLACPRSL